MGMASYFEDGREKHKRFADTAQGKKNEKEWFKKMETAGRRARRSKPKSKEEVAQDPTIKKKLIRTNLLKLKPIYKKLRLLMMNGILLQVREQLIEVILV